MDEWGYIDICRIIPDNVCDNCGGGDVIILGNRIDCETCNIGRFKDEFSPFITGMTNKWMKDFVWEDDDYHYKICGDKHGK
jgi:hypothetical protein